MRRALLLPAIPFAASIACTTIGALHGIPASLLIAAAGGE